MIMLWFTKIKLGFNEINDVPERYYQQVADKLAALQQ
jgi:hypothetical protein